MTSHDSYPSNPSPLPPEPEYIPAQDDLAEHPAQLQNEAVLDIEQYNRSDQFNQYVEPVVAALHNGSLPENIPGYLGSGGQKHAFKVDTPEGPIVVKPMISAFETAKEDRPDHIVVYGAKTRAEIAADVEQDVVSSVKPLIRSAGVAKLEQLLSADTEKGVIVTTFSEGTMIHELPTKDLKHIKKEHLHELEETLESMRQLGLHPHNMGGVLFDPKSGFSFVDYEFGGSDPEANPFNRGPIESLEGFIGYALEDHKKFDALNQMKNEGASVPRDLYRTTGMRALRRAAVLRRARKLTDQADI